jgi:lipopolysaccharide O-acetyltransferase
MDGILSIKKKNYADGIIMFLIDFCHRGVNKIYNFLVFGRTDIWIDYTAHLIGKNSIEFGKNFQTGKNIWIEAIREFNGKCYSPRIVIKDNVRIQESVHIGATNYIEIGNNVLIASKVFITDHNHGIYSGDIQSLPNTYPWERVLSEDRVLIGDNVWIGDNVTILPGVIIGKGSVIGANSVVTKNVPVSSIVIGVPARVIKHFDDQVKKWVKINE